MSWRYSVVSVLILLATLASRVPTLRVYQAPPPSAWLTPAPHNDPESRLAMGDKLALACADISTLELIKGISDTLAFEILERRFEIIRAARTEPASAAIQRARGIGPKTAEKIVRYLDLNTKCMVPERYDVWHR